MYCLSTNKLSENSDGGDNVTVAEKGVVLVVFDVKVSKTVMVEIEWDKKNIAISLRVHPSTIQLAFRNTVCLKTSILL
jgi:predicted RNA-binding protein with TRAM domain